MAIIVMIGVAAWVFLVVLALALCRAAAHANDSRGQPSLEPVHEPAALELSDPDLVGQP